MGLSVWSKKTLSLWYLYPAAGDSRFSWNIGACVPEYTDFRWTGTCTVVPVYQATRTSGGQAHAQRCLCTWLHGLQVDRHMHSGACVPDYTDFSWTGTCTVVPVYLTTRTSGGQAHAQWCLCTRLHGFQLDRHMHRGACVPEYTDFRRTGTCTVIPVYLTTRTSSGQPHAQWPPPKRPISQTCVLTSTFMSLGWWK
jgi:hypothetical protein